MNESKRDQAARIQNYARLIEKQTGKAVRPFRQDGYMNMVTRYGTSKDSHEHYQFVPEPTVPDDTFSRLYEGNGLFAKIIDAPAEEAFKHGFTLKDVSDSSLESFYQEALDELDWDETAMTALKWMRLFGGSIIVMLINDGGGLEEPLNWQNIKSIDDLRVYDRSVIQPDYSTMFSYDPRDPFRTRGSRLGMPEYYHVNSRYGTFTVHESRCLVFQNGVLPENASNTQYQLWGMPEYVRLKKALRDTELAHSSAPRMLDRSVQPVYKMKELASLLATDEGEDLVLKRMQVIDLARGLLNSLVIDSEGEDYDFKSFQFTGVSDVIDTCCNFLSALTNIPQTILFGRSPAGMNATGDSDFENWYSFVGRIQKRSVKSNLRYLLSVIFQAGVATGEIDEVPKIKIEFNPLWTLSDSEKADLDLKNAQIQQTKAATIQTYVGMEAIDPSEVRRKLADSGEFDIDTILDEYEDEEELLEAYAGQEVDPDTKGHIPEQGSIEQYAPGVDIEAHNTNPGTEGSTPANAPAATKLPQDMTAEEKAEAEESAEEVNQDDAPFGVGVLVIQDGKILCGKRHNDSGYGLICGPGGHGEKGETPEQAAFRETEEEFGISPKELVPLGIGPFEPESGLQSHIFLCTEFEGEPDCVDLEMSDPKFRTLQELKDLEASLFPPFRDSLEILSSCLLNEDDNSDGGPGSGNFGHEGVEGQIGGSAPAGSNVGGEKHKPISERSAPAVKSKKSFDKYVEEKGLRKIYRGFAAQSEEEQREFTDSIKNGTVPNSGAKSSALGSGVYFSDEESEATDYMNRRKNESGGKHGAVVTAALDVDARIANSNDLSKEKLQAEHDACQKAFSLMGSDAPQEEIDKAIEYAKSFTGMSISDYAKSQGYDAIYDKGTRYTVVVNQNALVVQDDTVNGDDTSENISENQKNSLDFSPEYNTIKSSDTTTDQEDGGPGSGNFGHQGVKGQRGGSKPSLSAKDKAKYDKRIKGKKTSDGVEVKKISSHAYDRIAERRISPKRIEDMLASATVTQDKNHPDRRCYDVPGSRLVMNYQTGEIVTIEWRKQNK